MTARRVLALLRALAAALALALALGALSGATAFASCGAETCPLDRTARAPGARLAFGLDLEYVPQDRVRIGTSAASVGQLPSPENEVRTVSRVVTATALARPLPRWRFDLALPFVSRDHVHDALPEGDAAPAAALRPGAAGPETGRVRQSWRYAGLGDATAAAAWRATSERAPFELWLRGGLKAPTGARSVPLVHGEEPEPAARPGTGSWDALAGVHAMLRAPWAAGRDTAGTMFAGLEARWNGRGTEGYRVGRELRASLGASRRLAGPVTALGQLNLRVSGRDTPGSTHGLIANTGGSWLFVSPGFSVRARGASISAHLQIPVVQRVNRIQLVAPWMLLTGVTWEI